MSSNLVKSFNVVAKNGKKVVGTPEYVMVIEEPSPQFIQKQVIEETKHELALQKAQVQKELAEWRQKEQERFLTELEEQKRLGYEEGYQLGLKDGTDLAEEMCKARIEKSTEVLEQAFQEKAVVIKEAEPFVIELTTEIAKKVLQQELKIHPEALLHLIKQNLDAVYETSLISIGVAPEDFAFVQKQRQQLMTLDNGQVEVKVFPDYSIVQGGCIIRTESGSVDARIDVQLSEIKKALLSYQQEETRE